MFFPLLPLHPPQLPVILNTGVDGGKGWIKVIPKLELIYSKLR